MEAAGVPEVDPRGGRELDLLDRAPLWREHDVIHRTDETGACALRCAHRVVSITPPSAGVASNDAPESEPDSIDDEAPSEVCVRGDDRRPATFADGDLGVEAIAQPKSDVPVGHKFKSAQLDPGPRTRAQSSATCWRYRSSASDTEGIPMSGPIIRLPLVDSSPTFGKWHRRQPSPCPAG